MQLRFILPMFPIKWASWNHVTWFANESARRLQQLTCYHSPWDTYKTGTPIPHRTTEPARDNLWANQNLNRSAATCDLLSGQQAPCSAGHIELGHSLWGSLSNVYPTNTSPSLSLQLLGKSRFVLCVRNDNSCKVFSRVCHTCVSCTNTIKTTTEIEDRRNSSTPNKNQQQHREMERNEHRAHRDRQLRLRAPSKYNNHVDCALFVCSNLCGMIVKCSQSSAPPSFVSLLHVSKVRTYRNVQAVHIQCSWVFTAEGKQREKSHTLTSLTCC